MKLTDLETPALVADRAVVRKNMETMAELLRGKTLQLRPHYKSNKCTVFAHQQIDAGAKGITCAKLSEAEDLIDAGIENVLIANQIAEPAKIRRAAELAGRACLTVCVDDAENARALSRAANGCGHVLHCYVEYDIGMERCGLREEADVLALALLIRELPALTFDGIQAYAGHVSHMVTEEERREYTRANGIKLRRLLQLLAENGVPARELSGGSTGTSVLKAEEDLYTELQAGSYFFLDATYRQLGLPFENSLYVLSTVVSKSEGLTVLDAGVKSLGMDQGDPVPLRPDGTPVPVEHMEANEEHLKLFGPDPGLAIGEKLLLIPGHCCSTVNLYDRIYLMENGKIVDRYMITARGASR